MNDLEILVPADTTKTIILDRLKDFKKWGLMNIQDRKIKLVLAATAASDLDFLKSGWPEEIIDVDVLTTNDNHVAQRLYNYYHTYAKPDTARWYLRIDEDSFNDIDGLVANLDKWYDHEREYHLSGEFNDDVEPIEQVLLSALGFKWWFMPHTHGFEYAPLHDHEISATSNAAMKRILKNENVKTYFELRKTVADGHGDHGLCYAALMEKIQPSRAVFMTREPKLGEFSLFGGHINHIHHVGRDKHPEIVEWLEATESDATEFVNKQFLYSKSDYTQQIKLNQNRSIEEVSIRGSTSRIGIWGITNDGKITFYLKGDMRANSPPIVFDNGVCREHIIRKM